MQPLVEVNQANISLVVLDLSFNISRMACFIFRIDFFRVNDVWSVDPLQHNLS